MDIYEYAESINWNADYMDINSGYIYKIRESGIARKLFNLELPIKVYDSYGNFIGYAEENKKPGELNIPWFIFYLFK